MFRATSEMAVAINVRSDPSNPRSIASALPFWRAVTMSIAELIATRVSLTMFQVPFRQVVQIRQTFLEVKGCSYPFKGQPQLDHGERYVGLNADDNGFCAP